MLKTGFLACLITLSLAFSAQACPNFLIPAPGVEPKTIPNHVTFTPYWIFEYVAKVKTSEPRLKSYYYKSIWSYLTEDSRWAMVNVLKQRQPQYKRELLYYFLGNAVNKEFVVNFWESFISWLSTPEFDVFAESYSSDVFEVLDYQGSEALVRLKHGGQELKAQLKLNNRANNGFWTLGIMEFLHPETLSDERCEGDPADRDFSSYDNPNNHEDRYPVVQFQEQVSTGKIQRKAPVYNPTNHLLMILSSKTLGDNSDLYALDPQTGKSHRLTWFEGDPRYGRLYDFSLYPRWSADRQQIAFVMNDEVYTMRNDGTQLKRRMDHYPYNESVRGVDWLGSDLVFASEVRELPESLQGNAHYTAPIFLFRLNLQAQTREQIPFSLNDGDILLKKVYVHKNRILTEHKRRNPLGYTEWFERDAQGHQVRKMALPTHHLIEDVQLSPDGQSILYHKRMTKAEADKLKKGKNCVWHVDEFLCESAPFIAKANGSNPKQLFPAGEAYYSVWSQDGKKVYHLQYVHPDKGLDFVFETRTDGSGRRKVYQAPPGRRLRFIWP
ncbi:MAG: hypothetical protein AB7I41_14495 [Candidatus Sericytochromatia bacterium]